MARRAVYLLLLCVALLAGLGITMLASTSSAGGEAGGEYVTVWKQSLWAALAALVCFVAAIIDYNRWFQWRWWIFGLAIAGLLLCYEWHLAQALNYKPLVAIRMNGACRWLKIWGQDLGMQPSEFAKIALIVGLAAWCSRHAEAIRGFRHGVVLPGVILGSVVLLIGAEVDLGNASVAALTGLGIMFVAGTRAVWLGGLLMAGGAALGAGIALAPNRFERVMLIFDLERHKEGLGLQQWVSMLAFGSGGLDGRGLGEGRMKLSYLPEAHTDFIFPMVGEELGFWGATGTVVAFVLMAFCGMCIAIHAPNRFGKLLGFGLSFLLALEALLNMGVTTALLPNKGLPLPFVSYGGSSLVAAMVAVGMLINIHRQGVHLSRDQLPVIRRRRRWTPQI